MTAELEESTRGPRVQEAEALRKFQKGRLPSASRRHAAECVGSVALRLHLFRRLRIRRDHGGLHRRPVAPRTSRAGSFRSSADAPRKPRPSGHAGGSQRASRDAPLRSIARRQQLEVVTALARFGDHDRVGEGIERDHDNPGEIVERAADIDEELPAAGREARP